MPAGRSVFIYYPQEGKADTLAFDYPIGRGGLAFHGRDKRLDNLVRSGLLRLVETDKIDLPAGIHQLNIPYDKWKEGGFFPSLRTTAFDAPFDGTIPTPAGFRSNLPPGATPETTPSLRTMMEDAPAQAGVTADAIHPAVPARPIARPTPVAPQVVPAEPVMEAQRPVISPRQATPTVDPTTGATIMPAEGPAPDLSAELDPDAARGQDTTRKVYTMDEINAMPDDQVIEMAKNHGFRGSSKARAVATLVDKGEVERD